MGMCPPQKEVNCGKGNGNASGKHNSQRVVMVIGSKKVGKDLLISKMVTHGEKVGVENETEQSMVYRKRLLLFRRMKKSTPEFFLISINRYMQESQVMLLCVDLSNASTMTSFSDDFFEKVLEYSRAHPESTLRLIIVGCKCDKSIRNHKEEEELSAKCRELSIPFFEVSALLGTHIQDLLEGIISEEKNITSVTVNQKISLLHNSKYLGPQSSLRDESALSMVPSARSSVQSKVHSQRFQPSSTCEPGQQNDEESKIDSNSNVDEQSILLGRSKAQVNNAQMYIRIIPHEKMYGKRIQLDKGNFGIVYKTELDGQDCALKVCKVEMKDDSALNRFQIIFSEAENMQRFMLNRSMRIMPLKGISFQVDMQRENVLIGYWMPLCQFSLKHVLKNSFCSIDLKRKIRWSLQIIECLEVFDKEHIQHMDLKPQNLLIDMNDDIIVSDLSMSKVFEEKQTEAFNMLGTTVKYAHPAAIVNHELSPRFDIYSFGVILLELYTGKQPWGDIRRDELKGIYSRMLISPESMNPLVYHTENYSKEMSLLSGKFQPIKDIIYLCCVAIFIPDQKDMVTINNIKVKFKELELAICGADSDII